MRLHSAGIAAIESRYFGKYHAMFSTAAKNEPSRSRRNCVIHNFLHANNLQLRAIATHQGVFAFNRSCLTIAFGLCCAIAAAVA